MYTIRQGKTDDIPSLSKLLEQTILTVNRKDYTQEEVEDWASCGKNPERWNTLFSRFHFFVAENNEKEIVGFSSVSDSGFLHSMFVHADYQRQGIAGKLWYEVREWSMKKGAWYMEAEVSHTARPFFEKQGFFVVTAQKRRANRLYLANWRMKKYLYQQEGVSVALPEDREAIFHLQKKAFHPVAVEMNDLSIPPLTETYKDFLASLEKVLLLKYTRDGKIVGSIRAYTDENNYCQIGKLIVDPACQHQGIGKILMNSIEAYFSHCQAYRLFTAVSTPYTVLLYKKLGYKELYRDTTQNVPMVFMEKPADLSQNR